MKRRWIAAAAATMWLAGVASSYAQTSVMARAWSWDFAWSIYDANPNDGLAPSVSFLDPVNAWRSFANVRFEETTTGDLVAFESGSGFSAAGVEPATVSKAVSSTALQGSAGIRSYDGGTAASIRLDGPGLFGTAHAGISSTATGPLSATFYNLVLGPGTGLLMSTWAQVDRWLQPESMTGRLDYADAYVELFTQFSRPDANGLYSASLRVQSPSVVSRVSGHGGDRPFVWHTTNREQLSLQFENLTDGPLVGRIRVSTNVFARSGAVAVVPEPASAALLFIGGGVLLVAMRRRAGKPA
ncbi:MAG: PEP-CTERM sorting domain-containing protein [Rubrivivax sp.]|nr:PEP-CTERM sorting domain-containing protein [Rubrivivax sp.]MDP3085298.1 PEP-CTERM sorting domain-containing protein [Rubrivivax sp.]